MSAFRELTDDLLMATMNAIKNANRQPAFCK